MKLSLVKLLNKKMTRQEFLLHLGLLTLAVFGISSFLKNISNLNPKKQTKVANLPKAPRTFGSGAYGV